MRHWGFVFSLSGLLWFGCGSAHPLDADGDSDESPRERAPAPSDRPDGPEPDDAKPDDPDPGSSGAAAPDDLITRYGIDSDPVNPVFDPKLVRRYEFQVDPDAWAHINETAYLEEYIEGNLTVDGERFAPIGLRFKGFRGSLYNCFRFDDNGDAIERTCERLSLKVSFNEYDESGRFYGLRKLNFHAMNNDPSKLRERLAYFMFRRFGVPAPRAVHATLTVNGQDLGLYALVEEIDGRFTRMRFRDGGDGNVYKERWPTSSDDEDYFRSGLETNEDDPDTDVAQMAAFAAAVRAADADTIEDVLREYTNFDALMRYLAVDRAIDNWDGITAFRCQLPENVPPLPAIVLAKQTPPLGWEVCQNKNFFWYEEEDHGPIWLMAWDTDVSFPLIPSQFPLWDMEPEACEVQQSGRPPKCDPLIHWFATALRPHFVAAGEQLLDQVFRPEVIEPAIREWSAQIQPHLDPFDLFAIDPQLLIDRVADRYLDFQEEIAR